MMMPRVQTVSSVYAIAILVSRRSWFDVLGARFVVLGSRFDVHNGVEISPADHERRAWLRFVIVRDRQQRRLLAQAFDVGAGQTLGATGDLFEIDVTGERDLPAAQPRT